ncbi:MAG TPA: LPXTG cell wall anchor domain-containing protein [Acidimicrobiales bacterium]|nr:LPXTG cell wall anchor domain-containing protein [Acidimicrobiales bacterium]
MSTTSTTGTRITRGDIESKLRQIRGEAEKTGEAAKSTGMIVGGVVAVAVIGLTFLLGKRRGRRKSTIVEIRRV